MASGGIVLCGGRSSRMGLPKAWLPWQGTTLLGHVVTTLAEVVEEVVAVAAPDMDVPPSDARIVIDREPGLGPLAGIGEGLSNMGSDFVYVTGTDAPFLTPSFVRNLLGRKQAAAPQVGGIIQTLAAVYPRCAATAAKELLAAGRRRPLDLLEAVNFVVIGEEELDEPKAVCSLNTPEEYLAAVRASDPQATAVVEFLGRARLQTGKRELEFPVATLGELLRSLEPQLQLIAGTELVSEFRISIDGRFFSRDLSIPIGAGEHVIVLDASAGG